MTSGLTKLETRAGTLHFPTYIPVTTFGNKYPLDGLLRPYLPRLASAQMVSFHYAKQMTEKPNLPTLIDSGGFASLFKDVKLKQRRGLGIMERTSEDGTEQMHPRDVLELQEEKADVAFTLDFPIPPSTEPTEARRRLDLTIANAHWALANRRRKDLRLYACVQAWDAESARECARAYADADFDGIAIGGLVPRARNRDLIFAIVDAVREVIPDKPIHAFGLGNPGLVAKLFERGVQSVDSSSYVKLAADGRLWSHPDVRLSDASPAERLQLALFNLTAASQSAMPLSAACLRLKLPRLFRDGLHPGVPVETNAERESLLRVVSPNNGE